MLEALRIKVHPLNDELATVEITDAAGELLGVSVVNQADRIEGGECTTRGREIEPEENCFGFRKALHCEHCGLPSEAGLIDPQASSDSA